MEPFNDFGAYELRYEVVEYYAGYAPGEIIVYEELVKGRHIIGMEAHLILFGSDSLYYPHTIYTSVDKDFYVQKGMPAEISGKKYSLEQLIDEAKKAEASGLLGKRCRDEYTTAPSESIGISMASGSMGLESAYREADVVLEVFLGPEEQVNKYLSRYTIVETSTIKSTQAYEQLKGNDIIALPPGHVANCPSRRYNGRDASSLSSNNTSAVDCRHFVCVRRRHAFSVMFFPMPTVTSVGCIKTPVTGTFDALTSTVHVLYRPFDVLAVMVTLPADTPLTTPLLTVATFSLLEFHVKALFVAFEGDTVAVSVVCALMPTVGVGVFGLIWTPVEGTSTFGVFTAPE
ncbi:MAG: hypothetical protein FWG10_02765 [Eubacteriaceae bacterium]|nr:hypothetical protein [Eubacteriaceae bacterium]